MNYSEWKPYYRRILSDFHLSESSDKKSAQMLSNIIENDFLRINDISKIFNGKEILIIGDSPYFSFNKVLLGDRVLVTADDATRHVLKLGIVPDLVVTDLDAGEELLLNASSMGAIMCIHAHGDNMDKLKLAEKFDIRFGTTQAEPLWNVYNFGGFTDGDRAVFLAQHFKAKKILIAGFNFYDPNQTKGKDFQKKMKKLTYSKMLITLLKNNYNANIIIL